MRIWIGLMKSWLRWNVRKDVVISSVVSRVLFVVNMMNSLRFLSGF